MKRVSFAHAALGPRATYERIRQVPVQFEAPFTEAVFARELMSQPTQWIQQYGATDYPRMQTEGGWRRSRQAFKPEFLNPRRRDRHLPRPAAEE